MIARDTMQEQGVEVLQAQPNRSLSCPDPEGWRGHTVLLSLCCPRPHCEPSNLTVRFTAPKDKWRIPTYGQPAVYNGVPLQGAFTERGCAMTWYMRASLLCGNCCAKKQQSAFSDPIALPHTEQGKAHVSFITA